MLSGMAEPGTLPIIRKRSDWSVVFGSPVHEPGERRSTAKILPGRLMGSAKSAGTSHANWRAASSRWH